MIQSRALYPTSKISFALAISKCGRERVRMREQWWERITQKHRGEHRKGHIFSKKAYLAINPCHATECTNKAPLSPGDTRSIKDNFQRSPTRQNGRSTKIMSVLWGIFFLLSIIKIVWKDIAGNCCSGLSSPVIFEVNMNLLSLTSKHRKMRN